MFWDARQLPLEDWKHSGCDMVLRIRRPRSKDANSAAMNVSIPAYSGFSESEIVGHHADSKYYLKLDAGLHVARRRVEAVHKAFKQDEVSEEYVRHLLKRDFQFGSGFQTLLSDHV